MTCFKDSFRAYPLAAVLVPMALLALPAAGSAAVPGGAAGTAGTNVVGTDDAAMGLIVLPWKPLPDDRHDRSPNIFGVDGDRLDAEVLRAQIEIDTGRSELRRKQIESGR